MSDNYNFLVQSKDQKEFELAMQLAFKYVKKASHFKIKNNSQMTFASTISENNSSDKLPYEMDCKAATEFAWNWLQGANYGSQPDIDGGTKKGFCVSNCKEDKLLPPWGCFGKFVTIETMWMIYHK